MAICPRPGGGLTHAKAQHNTPYGLAEVAWKIHSGIFELQATIPPNTTARVTLPNGEQHDVGSGVWNWSAPYQDPDARGPFTLDDLTGEIMSDHVASKTVLEAFERLQLADHFLRAVILGERNMVFRQSLRILPNYEHAVKVMDDALTGLNTPRRARSTSISI